MKFLGFNPWSYDRSYIKEFVKNMFEQTYDEIIFFHQNEFEYWGFREFDQVLDIAKSKNKRIKVLTGAHTYLKTPPRKEEIDLIYFPVNWIVKAHQHINKHLHNQTYNIIDDYKYHFISMNFKPHEARCHLMDLVAKYDLHKNNPISWYNLDEGCQRYKWKHWIPEKLILNENFLPWCEYYLLPEQYKTSFAQLVSETMGEDIIIISEKTATPLILGKPFLVAAAPGFHGALKDLKFELYEEIFDYSFDLIWDRDKRFDALVKNFVKLSEMPPSELKSLNNLIREKVEYNKKRVEEIVFDSSNYPQIIKDMLNLYRENGTIIDKLLIDDLIQYNL